MKLYKNKQLRAGIKKIKIKIGNKIRLTKDESKLVEKRNEEGVQFFWKSSGEERESSEKTVRCTKDSGQKWGSPQCCQL